MTKAAAIARIALAGLMLAGCAHPAPEPVPETVLADGSPEAITATVNAVTAFPDRLDPRIWAGTDMRPEVRERSLAIVERLVRESGIPGLSIDAVELFGSNASYEYDDASDFGLHVFVHSAALSPADLGGVLRLLNDDVERRQERKIRFNGVVVEVSLHGERGANYRPSPGIGQYSLTEGRWIEEPVRQPDHFDRTQMATDVSRFVGEYNDLASEFSKEPTTFDCARFGQFDRALKTYRDSGFAAGLGSRSTQNLSYRALRRLNVSIPDMLDRLADDCVFTQESIG